MSGQPTRRPPFRHVWGPFRHVWGRAFRAAVIGAALMALLPGPRFVRAGVAGLIVLAAELSWRWIGQRRNRGRSREPGR